MTEDAIPMQYWGCALEDVPEEIQARLRADPEVLAAFEAQHQVAVLMGLKRYETPDPALEGRLSHRVGLRIENLPPPHKEHVWKHWVVPEWARMVAVVSVMLGLSVLVHREMLMNETELEVADPHVMVMEDGSRFGGDVSAHASAMMPAAADSIVAAPSSPSMTVRYSDLQHQDAFTTRLPGFQLNLEPFEPGANGFAPATQTAISTNRWSSPLLMPVSNPNP